MWKRCRFPLFTVLISAFGLLSRMALAAGQQVTTDAMVQAGTKSGDVIADSYRELFGTGSLNPLQLGQGFTGALFNDIFFYLNLGALALGTCWFLYTVTAGTVQTAHEGEWLGRRYNSVWLPIRVGLGISSCAPIFLGWSALQWITLLMSTMGNGLANMAAVKVGADAMQAMNWEAPQPNGKPSVAAFDLATAVAEMHTCRAAYNMALHTARLQASDANYYSSKEDVPGAMSIVSPPDETHAGERVTNWVKNKWNSTQANATVVKKRIWGNVAGASCGSIGITDATLSPMTSGAANAMLSSVDALLADKDLDLWRCAVSPAVASGCGDVTGALNRWVTQAAQTINDNVFSQVSSLSGQIDSDLKTNQSLFQSQIKEQGWTALGFWFFTLMKSQQEINAAQHGHFYTITFGQNLTNSLPSSAQAQFSVLANTGANTFDAIADQYESSGNLKKGMSAENAGKALNEHYAFKLIDWLITSETNSNPLIAMKRLGDNIVDTYLAIETGKMVANVAMNFTGAGRALGAAADVASAASSAGGGGKGGAALSLFDAFKELKESLGHVLSLLFIAGLTLAYYIPMIPFINWFASIISYFANLVEGLFAGPVHAMAHMDGEGEGMGNRTTHGYLFMFNLFLIPILTVGGFLAANAICSVLGKWLMNSYKFLLADVAQENWVVGPISISMYLFIYCVLCLQLVNRCFDLCHSLRDSVLAFIGSPNMNRGEAHLGQMVTAAVAAGIRGGGGGKFGGLKSGGERRAAGASRQSRIEEMREALGGGRKPPQGGSRAE